MEFGESSSIGGKNDGMKFPLGFRFDPHPRELVFYVKLKNFDLPLSIEIPEVDLYECHPKKLTTEIDSSFGIYGNGKYYYFTKRKRRDDRGTRIKRSMNEGYWKTTSKDKDIKDDKSKMIGHRKTFKFFEGKKKKPTNWIMHEFRDLNTKSVREMDSVMDASTSNENSNRIEHYVLCMIYEKGKKCPTDYPPSTQAVINTGVDAIEEARESSIPQNQSMVCVSQPHEANMDQFQLPPYVGNYNEFPTSQEFLEEVRESSIPQNQSMVYASHPHEANSLKPNKDQFQLPPYFGNYNEFPTSQEFVEVRESSIPQNQSMVHAYHPHEANSLMPNMDQFQRQHYFGNDNGFSLSLEFPDDVMRHLIELDGENMHLHFLNPNPNTMF